MKLSESQSSQEIPFDLAPKSKPKDKVSKSKERQASTQNLVQAAGQGLNSEDGSFEPQSQPNYPTKERYLPAFVEKRSLLVDNFHENLNHFAEVYDFESMSHFPGFMYTSDNMDNPKIMADWVKKHKRYFMTVIYRVDTSQDRKEEVASYVSVTNPDDGLLVSAKKLS